MNKQYRVALTEGQWASLGRRIATGNAPARDLTDPRVVLKSDEGLGGPAWTDASIADALDVSTSTLSQDLGALAHSR